MTLQTRLEAAVALAEADTALLHDVVHGPASGTNSQMATEGGLVDSVAKAIADAEADVTASIAAMAFNWTFDATAVMADPGVGEVRFDNADLSLATAIAVSAQVATIGNADVSAFVATLGASNHSPRGTIRINKSGTPATFAVYSITGPVVDNGTWLEIPVAYVSGAGAIAAGNSLMFGFTRSGDDGDVTGPVSSTDNALVRWDGAGGSTVQNSGWILSDADALTAGGPLNEKKGADVATAATIDLDAATGNAVELTGTTNVSAVTLSEGRERVCRSQDAFTLEHGASLVCLGNANIAVAAGDFLVFRGYAAGVVRVTHWARLAERPVYRDVSATLTVGFPQGWYDLGAASGGAKTPAIANSNQQKVTVDTALTVNAPVTGEGGILIKCTNSGGGFSPTFSGFSATLLPNSMDWVSTDTAINWVVIKREGSTSYYGVYNNA